MPQHIPAIVGVFAAALFLAPDGAQAARQRRAFGRTKTFVGATGRLSADSGLAISSGSAPPDDPPEGGEEQESDLEATVASRAEGDVRAPEL